MKTIRESTTLYNSLGRNICLVVAGPGIEFSIIHHPPFAIRMSLMSEFDAQHVAERIDIVLDILVAGDYHSAIYNLEILKAELLRQVAESTPDIPKAPWEI